MGRLTEGKRPNPNAIPDNRIRRLHRAINLKNKSVLEIGCFEGIHTIGLRHFTRHVTAIDVRPVNVFKTLARLSLHGADAKVFVADCEAIDASFGRFDVIFHFGVLYHLHDPVTHLLKLGGVGETIYLDTHVAEPGAEHMHYEAGGARYAFTPVKEGGWDDPFSGTQASARHLTLDSLERALTTAGFAAQRVTQVRRERHGPRVLILASKSLDLAHVAEAAGDEAAALRGA